MEKIKIFIIILILSGCSSKKEQILIDINKTKYEIKQISNGNNNPDIDISKDSLDVFLVALHNKIPLSNIQKFYKWDDSEINKKISLLSKNGMLKKQENGYIPTVGIFSIENGLILFEKSKILSNEISDSIKSKISIIKDLYTRMDISENYSFNDLSFFFISDILLDMGQIGNVEREFLKKERTLRNGKNYYLAVLEQDSIKKQEAFGIYGNQGLVNSDSVYIGVYGNRRTKNNPGWQDYENKEMHFFNNKDFGILFNQMPQVFLPSLIEILEKNKSLFEQTYTELGYDEEITFNEFFIWWYHIIYTEATNCLIKDGTIEKPKKGLFYYKIQK